MSVINGTAGPDTLNGTEGQDSLYGTGGDDVLYGGGGADLLDGGAGSDRADYGAAGGGVTVDLALSGLQSIGAGQGRDQMVGVENLGGSGYSDTLAGNGGDNRLDGRGGNDQLSGAGGNDTLDGGAGSDTAVLSGVQANYAFTPVAEGLRVQDLRNGSPDGTDLLVGVEQIRFSGSGALVNVASLPSTPPPAVHDTLQGTAGADTLDGGDGNDKLSGLGGDDKLIGGDGDDTLVGGPDDDILSGGVGDDLAIYSGPRSAYSVEILEGGVRVTRLADLFSGEQVDHLTGIERIAFDDGATVMDIAEAPASPPGTSETLAGGDGPDTIDGGAGNDWINGGTGEDSLAGGAGWDTLHGSYGDDTLQGGDGEDLADYDWPQLSSFLITEVEGGVRIQDLRNEEADPVHHGSDVVLGVERFRFGTQTYTLAELLAPGSANETLQGGAGADTLNGAGGNDSLSGADGDDSLVGGAGDDTVEGGAGEDRIRSDPGNDFIDGGADLDRLSYEHATGGVQVSLALTGPQDVGGGEGLDTILNIEMVFGSRHADTLTGGSGDEALIGGGGSDRLVASAGDDTLQGGLADYSAATATIVIDIEGSVQVADAGFGLDQLISVEGVLAGEYNDSLNGASWTGEWLGGGGGDDSLCGDGGDDTLAGGSGNDVAFYQGDRTVYEVTQVAGGIQVRAVGGHNDGTDLLVGVERIAFSGGSDVVDVDDLLPSTGETVQGTAGPDSLSGGASGDSLSGLGGGDSLFGDEGADTLRGDDGGDTLMGGAGDDSLQGGNGDDVLIGWSGNDTLAGGDGFDEVDYGSASGPLTIDLALTGPQSVGGGYGQDAISGVERVAGGFYADSLAGDANANWLAGQGGDDTLMGRAGDDTLSGFSGDNLAIFSGSRADYAVTPFGDGVRIQDLRSGSPDGTDYLTDIARIGFSDGVVPLSVLLSPAPNGPEINGTRRADTLAGTAGGEKITGGGGDDVVNGLGGADDIRGDGGDDQLFGGAGNDLIEGGTGWDTLDGGAGNDTLDGSTGADRFVFTGAFGHDAVEDFGSGADVMQLDAAAFQNFAFVMAHAEEVGQDVVIALADRSIRLVGLELEDLTSGQFVFV